MDIKLCKDCRWSSSSSTREAERWRCFAPPNKEEIPNLVTGEDKYTLPFCTEQRTTLSTARWMCGKEGTWFEAKPPSPVITFQPASPADYHRPKPVIDTNALLEQLK
jgi:hypothetical protein